MASAGTPVLTGRDGARKLLHRGRRTRHPRRSSRALATALVGGAAILAQTAALARAEPPQLSLDTHARLTITGLSADAPATLEIAGEDVLPITWTRGDDRAATVPLVLTPGAVDPIVITLLKQPRSLVVGNALVPRVQIAPREYERTLPWRATSTPRDRRSTLLIAIAFATTVLLAGLLRRGGAAAVLIVATAWAAGLAMVASRRPTLIVREEADGSRWLLATEAQTVRVPVAAGRAWVPVMESTRHLQTLAPRIVVERNQARLELDLPAAAKVLLVPASRGRRSG